jgi:hypothetical protein
MSKDGANYPKHWRIKHLALSAGGGATAGRRRSSQGGDTFARCTP